MSGTGARRPADAAVAGLSGVRRYAFTGYRWLLLAFLLAGCVQIFLAGVLVVQTTLLQSLPAGLAGDAALYGGLHALDGLLVLGIAGFLYATSRRRATPPSVTIGAGDDLPAFERASRAVAVTHGGELLGALPVEIAADGIGRYPQDAEAAVYFGALQVRSRPGHGTTLSGVLPVSAPDPG